MFSDQTEKALVQNLPSESGMPGLVTLTAEAYRELVFAARQWDVFRSSAVIPTCAAQLPADLGKTYAPRPIGPPYGSRLTPVGCGDGDTYVLGWGLTNN